MHWSSLYIGIPHASKGHSPAGASCWGLVVLVYRQELGIKLPTYEERYASLEEQREIEVLVSEERASGPWRRVSRAKEFDIILFRQGRYETHVGIVLGASPRMLHIKAHEQAKVEAFDTALWQNRLIGIYRHIDVLSGAA